jgi:hypothetical protein
MRTLAALILCSSTAFAACPNGWPTISEEYSSSVVVLVGRVDARRATPFSDDGYFLDGDTYTVVPVHVLKGKPSSRIDLFSENSSGRFPMRMKRKYLLFIYEDHGRLMVDNCGNSELMPRATNTLAQTGAIAAHGSDPQAAFNSLRNASPAVRWSASSAKTADFDCDGKADTVMLGSEKDRAAVGIVWGDLRKDPQILTLTGTSEQPRRIDTLPLDCKDEDSRILAGCKITPACRTFIIRTDDTDALFFYWDASGKTLRRWQMAVSPSLHP